MRVFATDPITKTVERFYWDPVDESFVIETRQDVTDCVELTQAEFAMIDERAPWKGEIPRPRCRGVTPFSVPAVMGVPG